MRQADEQASGPAVLREEVRHAVGLLLERLGTDVGDDVVSLAVVGSAVTEDFHPRFSDINTVLVVRRRSHRLLQVLAGYGRQLGRRKLRAPLLMTPEYIERSLDVFGVEFLDFQLNHAIVRGSDPFAGLRFGREAVRLQCERELKGALMALRQGYISALGKPRPVAGLLADCAGKLAPLMRAMLWLAGADRPRCAAPTVAAAAGAFQFEPEGLSAVMDSRHRRVRPPAGQVETLFEAVYRVVDHLARKVDEIGEAS
ncbi:MAG: hypothetical protein GX591_13690 [Planctomycetes bacterium]|nr:hypothetical protein [Planctomycetota bacterium]